MEETTLHVIPSQSRRACAKRCRQTGQKVTVASKNAESITRVSEGSNGERRDCYAPDAR